MIDLLQKYADAVTALATIASVIMVFVVLWQTRRNQDRLIKSGRQLQEEMLTFNDRNQRIAIDAASAVEKARVAEENRRQSTALRFELQGVWGGLDMTKCRHRVSRLLEEAKKAGEENIHGRLNSQQSDDWAYVMVIAHFIDRVVGHIDSHELTFSEAHRSLPAMRWWAERLIEPYRYIDREDRLTDNLVRYIQKVTRNKQQHASVIARKKSET